MKQLLRHAQLLVQIRDRLVGIAYAELTAREQEIANLLIGAQLLRINEADERRPLEKPD
jgi:hypothetical protein